jgi:hypothetical protein
MDDGSDILASECTQTRGTDVLQAVKHLVRGDEDGGLGRLLGDLLVVCEEERNVVAEDEQQAARRACDRNLEDEACAHGATCALDCARAESEKVSNAVCNTD